MNYIEEQNEWSRVVESVAGSEATLLSVSAYSSDCRIYRSSTAVYKIRKPTPASCHNRPNWLEDEFLLLKHLSSIRGVPTVRSYRRFQGWEIIVMDPLPALLGYDPTFGQPRESLRDFMAVVRTTISICRLGCSHGDLHVRNAGRNVENGISFFDFDQAVRAHPLRCLLRDFLGFAAGGVGAKVSLLDRACDVGSIGFIPRVWRVLRRTFIAGISAAYKRPGNGRAEEVSEAAARTALRSDAALDAIAKAWEVAARSNASAPGVHSAYYSLDIDGINFPGERPWFLRWHSIRSRVDFRGKRFLELGCNLGLLSIHAKLNGASQCVGKDLDSDILNAAQLAAKGFGVDVAFGQLDLNSVDPRELDPAQFEIVSALSVMHWVQDKERLWAFLGRFPELLYEGHEPDDEAELALTKAGFTQVVRLGETERKRQLFLAKK